MDEETALLRPHEAPRRESRSTTSRICFVSLLLLLLLLLWSTTTITTNNNALTLSWWTKAESQTHHAWQTVANETQQFAQQSHLQPSAQHASDWTHTEWEALQNESHRLWTQLHDEKDWQPTSWWNKTITTEQDWQHHVSHNLRTYASTLRHWFHTTANASYTHEQHLQRNFQHWYETANAHTQVWWEHTKVAYSHFEHQAHNQTTLWWAWTEHEAQRDWNVTLQTEQEWWQAAQIWFHQQQASDEVELQQPLVYLNESKAYAWLFDDYGWFDRSADFFVLRPDVQLNQAYCAVATVAAVLNSFMPLLNVPIIDPLYAPHPYVTQLSLLRNNPCVHNTVIRYTSDWDGMFHAPGGLTLAQTKALLECHLPHWNVTAVSVDPATVDSHTLRTNLVQALQDPTSRVLVNYDRATLGQAGGGHFSPLGAYNDGNDAFLILDVAKYKYPPVWVPAARLWQALGTVDDCGMWDFPQAQDGLRNATPSSPEERASVRQALGCQPAYRGYIVVQSRHSS